MPALLFKGTPASGIYDIAKDPQETVNQYNNPEYKDVIAKLKQQLLEERAAIGEDDSQYPHIQAVIDEHWND